MKPVVAPARPRQLVERVPPARGEPSAAASAASAASAAPGAKRSAAAAVASSVEGRLEATTSRAPLRRTALRTRRSRIGASSTSSVSSTRIASAWSMSETRADRSARASARARVRRPRRRAGPDVTCGEPSPLRSRCCTRKPSSFVAWPPTRAAVSSPERSSAARRLGQRALPARLAQEAAVAHQRRGDALRRRRRTGSRSGPCRRASRRPPPRCRARARARPWRRRGS